MHHTQLYTRVKHTLAFHAVNSCVALAGSVPPPSLPNHVLMCTPHTTTCVKHSLSLAFHAVSSCVALAESVPPASQPALPCVVMCWLRGVVYRQGPHQQWRIQRIRKGGSTCSKDCARKIFAATPTSGARNRAPDMRTSCYKDQARLAIELTQ